MIKPHWQKQQLDIVKCKKILLSTCYVAVCVLEESLHDSFSRDIHIFFLGLVLFLLTLEAYILIYNS